MSKSTDTNLAAVPTEETTEAKKPSLVQKFVVNPVKKHPKLATAIAGGLVLVGGAAYLGRVTAPDATEFPPDNGEEYPEESDTTVA